MNFGLPKVILGCMVRFSRGVRAGDSGYSPRHREIHMSF